MKTLQAHKHGQVCRQALDVNFGAFMRAAVLGSLILVTGCIRDGAEDDLQVFFQDQQPPFFLLDDGSGGQSQFISSTTKNLFSGRSETINVRASDNVGVDFAETSVSCTVAGMFLDVSSSGITLNPPEVTEDTPYSCTVTVKDDAENSAVLTITGVIVVPTPDEDTVPPAITVDNPVDMDSGETVTTPVSITDTTETILEIDGACTAGVTASVVGSGNGASVDVQLVAPEVTEDTPYTCPIAVTDEGSNTTTAVINGTIFEPDPLPTEPVAQVTFWGECLAVQSNNSCDFFGGGSHFCEVSEPAATCNYNPLVEPPGGTTPQFLILEDANRFPATVDFSGWPQISESCTGFATERLTTAPNAPDTMLFECEAGSPGALVPPSVSGGATIISSKDGTDDFIYSVDVDANGNVVLTANLSAPIGFAFDPEGDVIRFAGGGEESDTVEVFIEDADGEALTIIEAGGVQGLETRLFVSDEYDQLWTFVYVHSDQDNYDATNPVVQGVIHAQNVGQGTPTNGGFILPLVSPELADFIVDNNLVVSEDIVISARNGTGFAAMFDGAAGGPGGPGAPPPGTPGTPPAVGGGVAITIPPERLIERQACPIYEAPIGPTRCTAGTDETLLVVNGRSEIARYSPINGAFEGFYRDDTASVFPATDGWEATQGPDNCVLYTDNSGAVLLYDAQGELITGDGNGDTSGTDPELLLASNNGALNYRGFDFYKLPNSDTWYLYIIEMTSFQEGGFTNPRARIVRYDYSLSGDVVLSNRTIVYSGDYEHFIDLVVIGDQLHLTSSDEFIPFGQDEVFGAGEARRLQIHADGGLSELSFYAFDSEFTGQITPSFDDGILVADFGVEQFRLFDGDDPSDLQAIRQTYNLMDQGAQPGTGEVVGIYPLRNGDYLVSGESPEIDRAVVARVPKAWELVPDGRSSEGRLIGRACLPE